MKHNFFSRLFTKPLVFALLNVPAAILLSCGTAWCQAGGVSFPDTMPQRGVMPNGSYTFDKLEAINKATGNLTYSIPLTSMPLGRAGMSVPVTLTYNSAQYDFQYSYTYSTSPPNSPIVNQTLVASQFGDWSLKVAYSLYLEQQPLLNSNQCSVTVGPFRTRLMMPDGSSHVLHFYNAYSQQYSGGSDGYYPWNFLGNTGCTNYNSFPGTYINLFTSDGSYIRVVTKAGTGTWTVYMPDGSSIMNCDGQSGCGSQRQVIADRNGNAVTITSDSSGTHLTDDAGRIINITSLNPGWRVTQSGFGGAPLTWTFQPGGGATTPYTIQYECVPSQGPQYCSYKTSGGGSSILQVPSNDPNNPLVYTFRYGAYNSLLQSVTLPTGATTTYAYQYQDYTQAFPLNLANPVVGKTVTWTDQDGSQRAEKWSYAWTPGQFQLTAPDGGKEIDYLSGYPFTTVTTKTIKPSGETIEYAYLPNRPYGIASPYGSAIGDNNPYIAAEMHSVATNGSPTQASITKYTVDKNGNRLSETTYDWIPYSSISHDSNGVPLVPSGATILRSISNTYTVTTTQQAGNGSESISDDGTDYWNPAAARFLHLISRSVTSGLGTGAATEYSYDGNANPIQERRWDSNYAPSLPSALSSSNSIVTTRAFSPHGNLMQVTDPNGNVTRYIFDSNDLFLSQKIEAAGTRVARTFNYGWDPNLSLITSITDADNGVQTQYSYDAIGRPMLVTEAAGSLARKTQTTYEDANRRVIVRRDQNSSGDGALVSVTTYDQLGRVALTQQLENASAQSADDPSAGIKVQTRYMYSGNNSYKLVSNPYRVAGSTEQTMGWTVTKFDQDGREIAQQSFDASSLPAPWGGNSNTSGTITTSYAANVTTVTDQAGKARSKRIDGLGRLVGVIEDPSGSPLSTTYAYDALDDLIQVNQSGQSRTFAYDSLKFLLRATNPENGTVSYTYDGVGNVTSKTDARNSTVTYVYDPLYRMIAKRYSDPATPEVTYVYDQGGRYSIGRLTATVDVNSATFYSSFDALGRVLSSSQVTQGQTYKLTYTYNLAGSVTSETLPSGRVIATVYDGANRSNIVTGTVSGQQTTYLGATSYTPHGAVGQYLYGSPAGKVAPLVPTFYYNNRLQQSAVVVNQGDSQYPQGDANKSLLEIFFQWGNPSTQNNGTVATAMEGYGPAVPANPPSWIWTSQVYSYDALNRLTSVYDNGIKRTFNYDAWGNMWVTNPAVLPLAGNTPTTNNFSNNRIGGASYDAAGNQLVVNGNTLGYDAESRQVSVHDPNTGLTQTYGYDANGRRVFKSTSGGSTTVFVYDVMGDLAAEYSTAVNSSPCTTCYLVSDYLGSTRLVTDQTGAVKGYHDYLPFGEEIPGNTAGRSSQFGPTTDTIDQKFTGKERDSESGLDYFGARYYGSALGRFTSPDDGSDQDPVNPQSWNLYSYVRNNPLTNIDPTGQDCVYAGNYSSTGTVGVETGNCTQSGGVYVNGTIDTSSLTYNPNTSQLGFSYSNGDTIGSGTIGNVQGPAQDSGDIDPFGAAVVRSLGARTDASYTLMGAFAAGSVVGGGIVAGGLGVAGSGVADGIITQTSQYLSKSAARALAQRLAATPAQAAAAASAISRATSTSSVKVFQDGTRLVVQIVRLGRDGYQEVESVIDQAGGKDVVQKAVNNAGDLVHYDPK